MNLLALQQAVYRRVKLPDAPSAADVTRITEFLNQRHRTILGMPGMDQFRDGPVLTFATVANQAKYGLPQALSRIRDLYDLTNQRRITRQSLDWLRQTDPGLSAVSSFSEYWVPLPGWGATKVELTATGVPLYVVSDNAGDVQKAYVETTRLGGVIAGTAVSGGTTVTGLTRAQIGTLSDHIGVTKFYLSAVAVGTVSIYDAAAAGTLLASITPGRTTSRYYMIQLYPTASAAVTISIDAQLKIQDLVTATEEPLLHEDFHMALVHGAACDEWTLRSDDRWKSEQKAMNDLLSDLTQYVQTSPDDIAVQRGPRGTPYNTSRLGSYFPSGT